MSFLLFPDLLFDRFDELTPEYLKRKGVKLLMSDLDNTLALHETPRPTEEIRAWIKRLTDAGIRVMIVSNNRNPVRVEQFCAPLGIPYEGNAGKPGTRGIYRAMARVGAAKKETAMLGDKLLTDMLAANLAGITGLMVEPLGGAVTPWQKVLHALQMPFKCFPIEKE